MLDHRDIEKASRLEVLRKLQICDITNDQTLKELTALAANICDAPTSAISLVGEDAQRFVYKHGTCLDGSPLEQSFCRHAMSGNDVFVVPDARDHELFADNPLVLEDPSIVFYAGAPLKIGGTPIGAFCVIDYEPRALSLHQRQSLQTLANAVSAQLELRKARLELAELEQMLPVCAWCHSVEVWKNGESRWVPLHTYIAQSTPTTHGICPDCAEKHLTR